MSFDSLLTQKMDVLSVTRAQDSAGGWSPTYDVKYSDLQCRHQETLLPPGPPAEIGGAPTLINVHQFFLRNPGPILTADVVIDEGGRMLRPASAPNLRRGIGSMGDFVTVTCREVQGADTVATIVLQDQNGDPVRDQDGALVLAP